MTLIQRGRGGWAVEMGGFSRTFATVLVIGALAIGGCSSKKNNGEGGNLPPSGAGMNDSSMNGTGGNGSLSRYQTGRMGEGSGGPLSDIHFDYNAATIQPQDNSVLKSNADWLTAHANTHVQIEGHCDDRGSEEYNIALGARRAQAAKDYLTTLGISGDRMSTISYGKELPLCTEQTDDCWAQNRRDHFAVSQ
jgi:peptidoglycan-associated lipoprotein